MPGIQATAQHATIVSGYEPAERRIFTYVPEPDKMGAIPESKFEDEWTQDNCSIILIVPSDMKSIVEKNEMRFKLSDRVYFESEKVWQSGRTQEAISRLRRALEVEHDNPQPWCLLGSIYNQLGSVEAIECYEQAIQLNDRYYLAYRGVGNYFLKIKEYHKANEWYSKAIEINQVRFAPIYKNRAICKVELGDLEGAKDDLLIYLRLLPDATDSASIKSSIAEL